MQVPMDGNEGKENSRKRRVREIPKKQGKSGQGW